MSVLLSEPETTYSPSGVTDHNWKILLDRGVPVIVVSKMLGHSKPSVTLDIYGHLFTDMQDGAARVMDDVVTPIPVDIGILKKTVAQ